MQIRALSFLAVDLLYRDTVGKPQLAAHGDAAALWRPLPAFRGRSGNYCVRRPAEQRQLSLAIGTKLRRGRVPEGSLWPVIRACARQTRILLKQHARG